MQNYAEGGLIPRLWRKSFSPIKHGTTEPEKCKAVLERSRKTFSAIIPTHRDVPKLCGRAHRNIMKKRFLLPIKN